MTDDRCPTCGATAGRCQLEIVSGRHCCGACHHPDDPGDSPQGKPRRPSA